MGPHLNPLGASLKQRAQATSRPVLPLPIEPSSRTWSASTDLYSYITERGFFFPHEVVSRYLVSLSTNPFVLFSGISGTGKTKLALLAAEYFAYAPGTRAFRMERPVDTETTFFVEIDRDTLRSGTLTPTRPQFDYFNVPTGSTDTFTVNITNILGAQGDMTFRANNQIYGGRKHLTVGVPVTVRRSFEETGVNVGDYLKFEILEEFKRFKVSLFRPERQTVEELPPHRYAFISVRPEWDDHTALLGSFDETLETYRRTPMLELLLRARREELEAERLKRSPAPYFVILDEMNIAKIEHYFSDFLSAFESRRYDADGTIRQETMNLHTADARMLTWRDEQGVEYEIPQRLAIPTNVLITGTVNDDESTYRLSPKVLDRANTMEFSAVDFDAFLGLAEEDLAESPFEIPAEVTKKLDLGVLDLPSQSESQRMRDALAPLLAVNMVLAPMNMHFGYRVLNDAAAFVANAHKLIGQTQEVTDAAIDIQILQKVLPKLFNITDDRNGILATLAYVCCTGRTPDAVPDLYRMLAAVHVDVTDFGSYHPELLERAVAPVSGQEHSAQSGPEGVVPATPLTALAGGVDASALKRALYPRSCGKLFRLLSLLES